MCQREKSGRKSGRWEEESRLTGEEKISQEERGVKKGQAEREESREETTGEHKTNKTKEKTEEKTGGERRNLEEN